MLRVGLTGSIATGKSTVLAMIGARDIPTISSDDVVRRLYEGPVAAQVEALFPGVTTDGQVDRQKLSASLVAEPERLIELEALIHPLVRSEIAAFFAAAEQNGAPLAVAEIPLLFESGHDYGLDAVIAVVVAESVQRQRALARVGMTVEKLAAILARQLPQADKKARATHVVDTSGALAETETATARVIAELMNQQAR